MNSQENELLCAPLAPEVYNKLNLVNCLYSEFFFKEMTNILNLQGMERWPMTESDETNHSQLLCLMVIFSPLEERYLNNFRQDPRSQEPIIWLLKWLVLHFKRRRTMIPLKQQWTVSPL
jgi:hypothetical protein